MVGTIFNTITVKLHVHSETGRDEFNAPIYDDNVVDVDKILVSPVSSEENINNTSLYGKIAVYQLAIPKGDTHDWEDTEVEFWGKKWKTFGFEYGGIEANIPLMWNAKVRVAYYE